jgi:hypothetical protein
MLTLTRNCNGNVMYSITYNCTKDKGNVTEIVTHKPNIGNRHEMSFKSWRALYSSDIEAITKQFIGGLLEMYHDNYDTLYNSNIIHDLEMFLYKTSHNNKKNSIQLYEPNRYG